MRWWETRHSGLIVRVLNLGLRGLDLSPGQVNVLCS